MSGGSQDWIFVAVFFGAFAAVTLGEIYWLISSRYVPTTKVLTLVFLSNFATITLGFFVTFIIFGLLLAFADGENGGVGSGGTTIAFIAALGFPFLLMAAIRRLLIGGMRISQISKPLPYSLLSTVIFFSVAFGLPAIFLALR